MNVELKKECCEALIFNVHLVKVKAGAAFTSMENSDTVSVDNFEPASGETRSDIGSERKTLGQTDAHSMLHLCLSHHLQKNLCH